MEGSGWKSEICYLFKHNLSKQSTKYGHSVSENPHPSPVEACCPNLPCFSLNSPSLETTDGNIFLDPVTTNVPEIGANAVTRSSNSVNLLVI